MVVKDIDNGKLISLSESLDSRGKYLYLFCCLAFFGAGIFCIRLFIETIKDEDQSWGVVIFLLLVLFALFLAAYRFLNKAVESEKIFIDKHKLQLIRTGFLNFKAKTYEIENISKLRHLEKPELPKHPLAGESFDYLGFQAQQVMINEMHGDNRVSFSYLGKTINFGQNVSSWEFEQLGILLYEMTGNNLKDNDDIEKTLEEPRPGEVVQTQPGLLADISFYQDLVGQIAVSEELQMELRAILKQAFDDPKSFYNESGDFILSERGLTYSIHSGLTAKFVLVDKMIAAKQMMEVDWKEAEKEIRIWILEMAKAKGYDLPLSTEKRYTVDTFETIFFISDKELEPMGYCLEILDIDSDSYVITIVPLEKQQMVHDMFEKLK